MLRITCFLSLFILITSILFGCSKGSNPVSDDLDVDQLLSPADNMDTRLFGAYLLEIAPDGKSAELTPMRTSALGESYLVSGLNFFTSNPCSNCLELHSLGYDAPYLKARFQISHPFKPGSLSEPPSAVNRRDLDVFDLAMVIVPKQITPVSYSLGDIYLDACGNQDGFTTELSNVTGSDTACPYFLVIDDSDDGSSTYNKFAMGTQNVLFDTWFQNIGRFDIYLTMGYGFSAKKPQRLTPKYYNPEFNRKSAWKLNVHPPEPGSTWTESDTTTPHDVTVEVYDWQIGSNVNSNLTNTTDVYVASEVERVSVEIPGMTSAPVDALTPTSGSGKPNDPLIYNVSMANVNGLPAGEYTGLVKVSDERVPPDPFLDRDFLIHSATQSYPAGIPLPDELFFNSKDVFVEGNYAYFAGGEDGFMIIDITDINNPEIIKKIPAAQYCHKVYASNGYAFVSSESNSGFYIIDIDPVSAANIVWSTSDAGNTYSIFESNGYAYVATGTGLKIYDVDPPSSAFYLASVDGIPGTEDVKVVGNYAYVLSGNGLDIVNVQNPSTPALIKSISIPTSHDNCVDVVNGYAYCTSDDYLLKIVDVDPPETASVIKTISGADSLGRDVKVAGNYAYVTKLYFGISVVDVSQPALASVVGVFNTPGEALNLDIVGNNAFITGDRSGLTVLNITLPETITLVSMIGYIGEPRDIRVRGDYAYIAAPANPTQYSSFNILDINPLSDTHLVNSIILPVTSPSGVDISGNYAYVAAKDLYIIDITSADTAFIFNSVDIPGIAEDVEYDNGYAYLAAESSGLVIVDVDPPSSASIVCAQGTGGSAHDVCVSDGYAYVADDSYRLQIFDVRNPDTGFITRTVNTPGMVECVEVSGNYAFITDGIMQRDSHMHVVNINPPESAYIAKTIVISGSGSDLDIVQNLAYLTSGSNIEIYDINPPLSTKHVSSIINVASKTAGMDITSDYIYVTCYEEGIRIFTRYIPADGELVNYAIPEYSTYQLFTAIVEDGT
jgi:hypothetical protein